MFNHSVAESVLHNDHTNGEDDRTELHKHTMIGFGIVGPIERLTSSFEHEVATPPITLPQHIFECFEWAGNFTMCHGDEKRRT